MTRSQIFRQAVPFYLAEVLKLFPVLLQAVATSMYCIGFAESFSSLVDWDNTWAIRGIGLVVLFALLAIALSGVKWVIRFQLILVLILAVAVMDFIIGTLVHDDPGMVLFSVYLAKHILGNT